MMQSMTGFGKAVCELPDKVVTIEVRSLNSKQLDIYARLPNQYKEKELDIRNLISKTLVRGKIECTINIELTDNTPGARINSGLVKDYYRQLQSLKQELNSTTEESLLQVIMRFPDALTTEKEELSENEWQQLQKKIEEALQNINTFRKQEGEALQADILSRIGIILDLLEEVGSYEADRLSRFREKLHSNLDATIEKDKIDENRFEQELIFYLEKIDITEEKVRLQNHCKFFREVTGEEEPVGKKLSFITQELGREINTIGSKANHSDIQRLVVLMKDELEKIKEQLMNVL